MAEYLMNDLLVDSYLLSCRIIYLDLLPDHSLLFDQVLVQYFKTDLLNLRN